MLKDNRNWFIVLLLSLITCGIYSLVLLHIISRDTNIACQKDGKHTRGLLAFILLSIITFGIYGLVWQLLLIHRWQKFAENEGLEPKCTIVSYILWLVFGQLIIIGPFVAFAKYIKGFNQVCAIYNGKK